MESNLAQVARLLGHDPAAPGSGAAGGAGYALLAWGARFRSGASADHVITGEGRFDEQSSQGKVPSYILGLAEAHGVRAALVAGLIGAPAAGFAAAASLVDLAGSSAAAMGDTAHWLRVAGAHLARGA